MGFVRTVRWTATIPLTRNGLAADPDVAAVPAQVDCFTNSCAFCRGCERVLGGIGSNWVHDPRDPIPYALETDWPVGAAGFEPLHIRIGIGQDSQPWGRESERNQSDL